MNKYASRFPRVFKCSISALGPCGVFSTARKLPKRLAECLECLFLVRWPGLATRLERQGGKRALTMAPIEPPKRSMFRFKSAHLFDRRSVLKIADPSLALVSLGVGIMAWKLIVVP